MFVASTLSPAKIARVIVSNSSSVGSRFIIKLLCRIQPFPELFVQSFVHFLCIIGECAPSGHVQILSCAFKFMDEFLDERKFVRIDGTEVLFANIRRLILPVPGA